MLAMPAGDLWRAGDPNTAAGSPRGGGVSVAPAGCGALTLQPRSARQRRLEPGSCVFCARATAFLRPRRQLYGWGYADDRGTGNRGTGDHGTEMYPVKLSSAPQRPRTWGLTSRPLGRGRVQIPSDETEVTSCPHLTHPGGQGLGQACHLRRAPGPGRGTEVPAGSPLWLRGPWDGGC